MMKSIITIPMLFLVPAMMQAQKMDELTTGKIVDSKNYIFKAESVTPQRGRVRQLTTEYDLTVSIDTVISFLPYFGRAYSAPIDPAEGGIKFTSAKFEYNTEKKNKHSWEIKIRPKDANDIQGLYLTIFDNGKATLRVNSINRESISYSGYIKAGKPRDKKVF